MALAEGRVAPEVLVKQASQDRSRPVLFKSKQRGPGLEQSIETITAGCGVGFSGHGKFCWA